jgi:predicted RecB family nuclease
MQSQYWSIDFFPGLTPAERELLRNHGIENTQELLKRTKTVEQKCCHLDK